MVMSKAITQSHGLLPGCSTIRAIAWLNTTLSNSNAIGSDGFLPEIIKQNAVHLSIQLAYIFNLSFSQGIFPKILKSALVIPVYKSGSHSDPSNYRPISISDCFF
jgi:hypothetical protein